MPVSSISSTASDQAPEQPRILSSVSIAVLAALVLRLLLCFLSHWFDSAHPVRDVVGQEAGYVAWSLHIGKGFSTPFLGYDKPTAWLAPVFPALWSLAFTFVDPFKTQWHIYFVQVLNSVFSALTCFPIYFLCKRLFNLRVAAVAAWTWAFLPLAILFPLEWAWDQSLSALLLMLLLCATYALREYSSELVAWSGYGILWGVAALTNPSLCVVLPFLLAWLIYFRRLRGSRVLLPVLTVMILFVLSLAPWTIRNYRLLGHVIFVKSNFGAELWLGNNPAVRDVYSGWLHPLESSDELQRLIAMGEYNYNREKQREAIAFIRENPAPFVKHVSLRVLDTWAGPYYYQDDPWIKSLRLGAAFVGFTALLSIAGLVGLLIIAKQRLLEFLPLTLCVALFPIPYYLTHSSLRYRHPIDPVLTVFAVVAVLQLVPSLRTRFGFAASQGAAVLRPYN